MAMIATRIHIFLKSEEKNPFSKTHASTGSVFESFLPVQMKKLKRWKGMGNDSNMYDITVFKSLRFRPSTRKREPDVLKKTSFLVLAVYV